MPRKKILDELKEGAETVKRTAKKVADKAAAEEVEAKKTVRAAGRKAKKVVEEAGKKAEAIAADVKETAEATVAVAKDETKKAKTAVKKSAADKAAAEEIEAKKTVSRAKRGAKKAAEEAKVKVEDAKDAAVDAALDIAAKVEDAVVASQIEAGKANAKRTRKAAETKEKAKNTKETVEKAVKTPAKKAAAAKLTIEIQSPLGGSITPEEIAAKVPKEAVNLYVRIDENRIYWVGKKGETGSVEIWE